MTSASDSADPPDLLLERLLRNGARPVHRYLSAHTDTPEHAEELTQETLVRAFVALGRGAVPEHSEAWLLGIARHVLLETWRADRARRRLRERQERELLVMGPGWEGLAGTDVTDQRLIVGEALDALPPELRVPVLLHYFGDMALADVAAYLATTTGAVKMRLLRARLSLRARLATTFAEGRKDIRPMPTRLAAGASGPGATAGAPLLRSVSAGLETGGLRGATNPFLAPVFSGGALSLDDLRFAIARLRAAREAGDPPLCDTLTFWAAPDPFNHPDPAAAWALVRESGVLGSHAGDAMMPLIPTDGWRLGTDPALEPMLHRMKADGLRHVWFTLTGLEETHDDLCARPGAFAAVVQAFKRCAAAGLETGANVMVSTRTTHQLAELSRLVRSLGGERFVPTYAEWWHPAGAAYEAIRPEPSDLAGLPPPGLDANWGYKDFWADPAAFTEAALVREALSAPAPEASPPAPAADTLGLIVDAQLNVHAGAWWAVQRRDVANLRDDSPATLYRKLSTLAPFPVPPHDAELARRYGDPRNAKVHTRLDSVRRKWVHAWRTGAG